jgi:hypothetical protein
MNKEYITPELAIVDMLETTCPLCASVVSLPTLEESEDMENLGWK